MRIISGKLSAVLVAAMLAGASPVQAAETAEGVALWRLGIVGEEAYLEMQQSVS